TACSSASLRAGRALPAAQPQTEFTKTSMVPCWSPRAPSPSSTLLSSRAPRRTISSRMGATRAGLYGISNSSRRWVVGRKGHLERMPRQARALHPGRVPRHSGEHRELAKGFRVGGVRPAGHHPVKPLEDLLGLSAGLALYS